MLNKRVPPEIWIQIIRFAAQLPVSTSASHQYQAFSPFDLRKQEELRNFEGNYARTLPTKISISLVCKCWRYLVFPLLWEVLCLLPGHKHHAIGSILQRYNAVPDFLSPVDDRRAGEFVRALHILEPEGPAHELYDMANIQRILRCCPNLATLTTPDSWQLFSRDSHISFQPGANLREVHLSALDEETIQRIFKHAERILIVHGSSFEIELGVQHSRTLLPAAHTISMRLSDMEDRNIFAPSLSRWIIHDSIIGLNHTCVYQRHAALVISLELACTWCDSEAIQSALSGMPNLQELTIHLDSLCLAPVPYHLPQTLHRLGFYCPYSKHGWVLDGSNGSFQWFLDHIDDWLGVALLAWETLGLVRFLDWEGVKLPKSSQRKSTYSAWWCEKMILFERAGIRLQNQYGNPFSISIARDSRRPVYP